MTLLIRKYLFSKVVEVNTPKILEAPRRRADLFGLNIFQEGVLSSESTTLQGTTNSRTRKGI